MLRRDNEGLRRTWRHTCLEENINPRDAAALAAIQWIGAVPPASATLKFREMHPLSNGNSGNAQCAPRFPGARISPKGFVYMEQ
jgi:hypothetical protein